MLNEKQLKQLEETKKAIQEVGEKLKVFVRLMGELQLPNHVTKVPEELNKDNIDLYLNGYIFENTKDMVHEFGAIKWALETFTDEELQEELFEKYSEMEEYFDKDMANIVKMFKDMEKNRGDLH